MKTLTKTKSRIASASTVAKAASDHRLGEPLSSLQAGAAELALPGRRRSGPLGGQGVTQSEGPWGPSSNKNGERTRVLIIDAAETLFSEHGLDGVSMRDIAVSAEVTLALVNYHFGSKDKLYRGVFERRIVPVSALRREALSVVLDQKAPPIRGVLDALARPWVEMRRQPGGLAYSRLIAREVGDPAEGKRGIVSDLLDPIALEFMSAMQKALPKMSAKKVAWAYHFFIGALLLILSNPDRVKRLSGKVCDIGDEQVVIDEIVNFFSSAFLGSETTAKKPAAPIKKPKTGKTKP